MHKQERERLLKHLDFLKEELQDFQKFRELARKSYFEDRDSRRNVERWVENLVNCSIDIGKVILTAKRKGIPETYREVLFNLGSLPEFSEMLGKELSRWARLRNILAHEYVDIRWTNIKAFIDEAEPAFDELVGKVEVLLQADQ